ncbi:MAG: VWA domain-containing protein [Chloroflexota bacterium]|nr:VWA domain-containing protein [Chloroflexota bacterium]
MNMRKWSIVSGAMILALTLMGSGIGATTAVPDSAPVTVPLPAQAQAQSATVVINEVMPKPGTGEYEWVELINRVYHVYLPLVFKGFGGSGMSGLSPAAPLGGVSAGVSLDGYEITDEDGNTYAIPSELPPVPSGAFVLIYFGEGTDDYDFSDNKAVLYAGSSLVNTLEDAGDQVALYSGSIHSADTIVDFVAWGIEPAEDATNAAAAGIWQPGWFATFESGFGDTSDEDLLAPDESLGRYPGGSARAGRQAFAEYQSDQLTPGAANPVPLSSFYTPENGAIVETTGFSVSWSTVPGATSYRFQLDDALAFDSPIYDTIVTESNFKPPSPLSAGDYYWRVKVIGGEEGPWISPVQIGIVVFGAQQGVQAEKVLGITPVRQNKDSRLLCLDGDPEGDPTTDNPENAWDAIAPCTVPPCANTTKYEHGTMYCVVASIRMMASYYGGNLTMDRIAYHIAQEWTGNTHAGTNDDNPNNDLAHDDGWNYHDEEDEGISWALDTTLVAIDGKPSFNDIKTWIDADRPIMFRRPGHLMVMDGYREEDGDQYIHILDPDQAPDCWRWQDYSTQDMFGYWPGPVSAPGVRSDEASVSTDSDGDGIMDFDEINRFFTSYTNSDSDGDWVPDKKDMREYVFNAAGDYSYRNADWDGDSDRKELDCDNDADGSPDGCEDTNYNGIYESGLSETDNFDDTDDQDCVPKFEITYPTHAHTLNAGAYNNPDKILIHLWLDVPACWPALSPSPSDFAVKVGAQSASAPILGYPVGDEYWILVQAPGQTTADFYDLEVTYDGALTDMETRAIYYLPRLTTDEVIVLDVSGSMSSYDKLSSAQNAARLFVDQWTTGDMIGAVAFSSTIGVPYPLEEIVTLGAGGEQEHAKDAIDVLTSGGMTAMGSGLLEGQDQLDTLGVHTHEHYMVLLSDGMENISPLWTDASVHDTIVDAGTIVHVVGLGPPEAAWYDRLEDVADETGGEFWPVDESSTSTSMADLELMVASPFPATLPNRLADAYKSAAEIAGHMQRLWEAKGNLNPDQPRTITYKVEVETGLGEAIFSVNWDNPDSKVELSLKDPNGDPVKLGDPGVSRQTDNTHDQYRIITPQGGIWEVTLTYLSGKSEIEYLAFLAAPSKTVMGFHLGLPPAERVMGAEMLMLAYLADHKPIAGATVSVTVGLPNTEWQIVELFDDGKHDDGKADDGVYANTYVLPDTGLYQLKVWGGGEDNSGQHFVRRLTRGFQVRPRAAYIYKDDMLTAAEYEKLLEGHGMVVDLLPMDVVPTTNFGSYNLIVVGPDTGYGYTWDGSAGVAAIAQSGRRVIGLGYGGSALFSELDLYIDWGQSWISSGTDVSAVNPSHTIWQTPYPIGVTPKDPIVDLYTHTTSFVAVYMPEYVSGVLPLGRQSNNQTHYPLIQEDRSVRYLLWGFNAGPATMTETGKQLFVNTAWHMIP